MKIKRFFIAAIAVAAVLYGIAPDIKRFVVWASALCGLAPAVPGQADDFVNDFANIIKEPDKIEIQRNAAAVRDRYNGAHIAVATVTSLEGLSIEEYAGKLFNSWGLENAKANRGVLFLIVPNGEKGARLRIEMGGGLESVIPDWTAEYILDQVLPYYESGDYSAGIALGVDMLARCVKGESVAPEPRIIGMDMGWDTVHGRVNIYVFIMIAFVVWICVKNLYILITSPLKAKGGKYVPALYGYSAVEAGPTVEKILTNAGNDVIRAKILYWLPLFVILTAVPVVLCKFRVDIITTLVCAIVIESVYQFAAAPLLRASISGFPPAFFYKYGIRHPDASKETDSMPKTLARFILPGVPKIYVCPSCSEVMEDASFVKAKPTHSEEGEKFICLICHRCRRKYEDVEILPVVRYDSDDSGGSGGGSSR